MIINGLPPGTTIQLAAIHDGFFNLSSTPGGSLGGERENFNSRLRLHLQGSGALAGYNRDLLIQGVQCETHVGPRTPGQPVQSFDTEMMNLQGQITGDPDFDLLRITAGTGFGMPSPGHTTLTRQGLAGSNWAVDSFFDITYRIDFIGKPGGTLGGMSGSTTGTIRMVAVRPPPFAPFVILCPSNITVTATGPGGTVVTYLVTTLFGDCPFGPFTVTCTPPSGSLFPIGTTTVNCVGSNGCGEHPTCSFTVTVVRPPITMQVIGNQIQIIWSDGMLQHADKLEGPYIDVDPQPTSPLNINPIGTMKFFRVRAGQPGFTFYDTEMLQLDISGGSLPAGMRIRESPTLPSSGKTAMSPAPGGGFVIDSFFDVFTELSTDGGQSWIASTGAPPRMRFTGNAPTNTLPPKDAQYVSPAQWHALYAQGIYITNASHLGFLGGSFPPPPPGGVTDVHNFGSTVNMLVRPCPTCPYQPVSAPANVTVRVTSRP